MQFWQCSDEPKMKRGIMSAKRKAVGALHLVSKDESIAEKFMSSRPSIAERMRRGKALRGKVPRSSLAEHAPPSNRKNPVAILEGQARTRIPELVPVRYARMLGSPFAFLRGGAAIMAQDLSPSPITGITVQACGDMHVANFGLFASDEWNLVFGINDFDETIPVVTEMAGFAARCFRRPGGGTWIPAALR